MSGPRCSQIPVNPKALGCTFQALMRERILLGPRGCTDLISRGINKTKHPLLLVRASSGNPGRKKIRFDFTSGHPFATLLHVVSSSGKFLSLFS